MKNILSVFLCVIAFFVINGCIDILSSKSVNPQTVIVNCLLIDSETQVLSLKLTGNVEDEVAGSAVTDAMAFLYDDSGNKLLVGQFVHQGSGLYHLDYRPIPNHHYLLEVTTSQQNVIIARTKMPETPPILPISTARISAALKNNSKDGFIPDFTYNDVSSKFEAKFYYKEQSLLPLTIMTCVLTSDQISNQIFTGIPGNYIMLPTMNAYAVWIGGAADKIIPFDYSDDRYWFYFKINEEHRVYPEGERPVPAYLPEFTCSALDTTLMTAFCFRSISAEYDMYIASVKEKAWTFQDPTGLSAMFDISNIYTNVSGGLGLFAAYSDIYCFYKGSRFVNFYSTYTDECVVREDITSYIMSFDWSKNNTAPYSYTPIQDYIQWLELNP